ncbi:MAG: type II toxin-antitoxin system VapC family toxin [Gemmatimonadales bacterium]
MILVDANVLMYAAGAAHANKEPSVGFLHDAADGKIEAVIDAEVLQEILHRYRAIDRWAGGRLVFDLARELFPMVIPITAQVMDRARRVLDGDERLMARDALHAAVVLTHGLEGIVSYDRDFDAIPGVVRCEP